MKRWSLLHVYKGRWGEQPAQHEVRLSWVPSPDTLAYVMPGLLVLRSFGGGTNAQEVFGVDPLNGELLWRFSETDDDLLFFSCHVEQLSDERARIVATTRRGVYLLTREGPVKIFERALAPASVGRLNLPGTQGYVLDEEGRLLIFSVDSGEVLWSRRAPGGHRFQHPFPMEDGSFCVSVGTEVRRISAQGETLWRWPVERASDSNHSIERYIRPDLLLLRSLSSTAAQHLTLHAETGELLSELGDLWAYGADGVTEHPVVLFEGAHERIALLSPDGGCSAPEKLHKMFRGFCRLPEDHFALIYDAAGRLVVCTDADGEVRWRLGYPDADIKRAATFFAPSTAYFATSSGTLHIWDVG